MVGHGHRGPVAAVGLQLGPMPDDVVLAALLGPHGELDVGDARLAFEVPEHDVEGPGLLVVALGGHRGARGLDRERRRAHQGQARRAAGGRVGVDVVGSVGAVVGHADVGPPGAVRGPGGPVPLDVVLAAPLRPHGEHRRVRRGREASGQGGDDGGAVRRGGRRERHGGSRLVIQKPISNSSLLLAVFNVMQIVLSQIITENRT